VTENEPESTSKPPLDLATAERISSALTELAGPMPAGRKPTPAEAIGGGLLAVRLAGEGVVCHYDPATGDPQAWDRAMRDQFGAETAGLIRYQPARTPPAELVALLSEIVRREWHPRASTTGLVAGIDWEHEVIDVTLSSSATDEVTTTLVALAGDRAVFTTGASFSRRSGAQTSSR
jgi:hypothetical protein